MVQFESDAVEIPRADGRASGSSAGGGSSSSGSSRNSGSSEDGTGSGSEERTSDDHVCLQPSRRTPRSSAGDDDDVVVINRTATSLSTFAYRIGLLRQSEKIEASRPFWCPCLFPISLCKAVAIPVIGFYLLVDVAEWVLSFSLYNILSDDVRSSFQVALESHLDISNGMLLSQSQLETQKVLGEVAHNISAFFIELPDRAVDGMWTTMRTYKEFIPPGMPSLNGATFESRQRLAYPMWLELSQLNRNRLEHVNRADFLCVHFTSQAFSAVVRNWSATDPDRQLVWYEAPPAADHGVQAVRKHFIEAGTGRFIDSGEENMHFAAIDDFCGGPVQVGYAEAHPDRPLSQMWSPISPWFPDLHSRPTVTMSWTSPVAYCGDYSCLDGSVSAGIQLSTVNRWCGTAWRQIRWHIGLAPNFFNLTTENSAVFIVNQRSLANPLQQGYLLSNSVESDLTMVPLVKATDAQSDVVRSASQMLLFKFNNTWDHADLLRPENLFNFSVNDAELQSGRCGEHDLATITTDCFFVATRSIELDHQTRWLLALVLPMRSFSKPATESKRQSVAQIDQLTSDLAHLHNTQQLIQMVFFAMAILLGCCSAALVSKLTSKSLTRLCALMDEFQRLEFSQSSPEFKRLQAGRRSKLKEVNRLQDAFLRFARSMRVFARFVPETVVRNILANKERALALHVEPRIVTVMFSDIRGFTEIAESLEPQVLNSLLTRYLTEMTDIVHKFKGVVTEILGDGVLAFWNPFDDVDDHPTKACKAALAMHQALGLLNRKLVSKSLPELAIRIGLHTGKVLAGNLGSETKMKFGCIGDPVNLASRLEGLCKFYGVGVLCSEATRRAALDLNVGLVWRMLDTVMCKGKREPTTIYEVVGLADTEEVARAATTLNEPVFEDFDELCGPGVTIEQVHRLKRYEAALRLWQQADCAACLAETEQLVKEDPSNVATAVLQERAMRDLQRLRTMSSEERKAWSGVVQMTEK